MRSRTADKRRHPLEGRKIRDRIAVFFRAFFALLLGGMTNPAAAWAFFCGPPSMTVNQGQTAGYVLSGDGVTAGNFEAGGGDASIAAVSPRSISSARQGAFTISGVAGGTARFTFFWTFQDGSRSGSCSLAVTVLGKTAPAPSAPLAPAPPGEAAKPSQPPAMPAAPPPPLGEHAPPQPATPAEPGKPKVDIFRDVIPKIPRYGAPQVLQPPGPGQGMGAPTEESKPMIPKGLREHIRSFSPRGSVPAETQPPVLVPERPMVPAGEPGGTVAEGCCCIRKIVFRNTTNLQVRFSLGGPGEPHVIGPRATFEVSGEAPCLRISFWYPDPDRNWGFAGQKNFCCEDLTPGPVPGFPGLQVVSVEKGVCPPEKCRLTPEGGGLTGPRIPTETVPTETVTSVPTETVPTETVTTVPTETVPTETVTTMPTETIPTETIPTETVPTETVPTETIPTETFVTAPCACRFLNKEWIPWQTIQGAYVYIPPPGSNVKIPADGKVELKAMGSDQDILIVRSRKTGPDGREICVGSQNVRSPDLLTYAWQIVAGRGQFKNGQRTDNGESVIYRPPADLPVGTHQVIVQTTIDDQAGKGNDRPNTGRIQMRIERNEDDPDHYYIDFDIVDFAPVKTPAEPPIQPCSCRIATAWKKGSEITHDMIKPDGSETICTDCTDIWVGTGADIDDLVVTCADPACGSDVRTFPVRDPLSHIWSAQFGHYLDGNTGEKVLYKAPHTAPPGPVPNETITLNTLDSGRQFVDKPPRKKETKIAVAELDLVVHKPKVIDPAEPPVPDEQELSLGAQTFVNLDNDDRDTLYDNTATEIDVAGEDEMVKLKLRLRPKELDRGAVRLEAIAGAAHIKVWREANKSSEYVLGSPLSVPGDFSVEGDYLEKTLYVEGISPHTEQRQTKLKMTYDLAPDCDDKVALTVIGIERIEWVGKNNSRNDDNVLDADPNHPAGLRPDAARVFPDARMAGGAVSAPRDTVDVKTTLTVKPIEPVKIYFDSFDVDDPTSDRAPVDDESAEEDNRGTSPARSGRLTGETGGILEKTFAEKEETFEFQVTLQPGDNFRIVGNGDRDFLADLENKESAPAGASNEDKLRVVNRHVAGPPADREIREAGHYAGNILTVWRFVHVESDHMANVSGNSVTGTVQSVARNHPAAGRSLVRLDQNLPVLGSLNRFEGGSIEIAGTAYPVISNAANVSEVVVTGLVPDPPAGTEYRLVDDDAAQGFGNGSPVPLADTGRLEPGFAPAFVLPLFDPPNPTSEAPFVLNTTGGNAGDLTPNYRFDNTATEASETFWTVYVLSALQAETTEDGDPDDMDGDNLFDEGGVTSGIVDDINGIGAHIFLEDNNELFGGARLSTTAGGRGEQDTVLHELGHLFGAEHPDGGLMDQVDNKFSDTSLHKIRSIRHP
ncbi:MAG: hypothetical protein HY579_09395 [Nitrospinae bacterium]|nr:hypothetical protein [Nitrospinota bacterium]